MNNSTMTIREQADQQIQVWFERLRSDDATIALTSALMLKRCSTERVFAVLGKPDDDIDQVFKSKLAKVPSDFDLPSDWFEKREQLQLLADDIDRQEEANILAQKLLEQLDYAELVMAAHSDLSPSTRNIELAKKSIADQAEDFLSADDWVLSTWDTFESNRDQLDLEWMSSTIKFDRLRREVGQFHQWRDRPAFRQIFRLVLGGT